VYEATVKFGAETDTDDCTGAVLRESAVPAMETIREAMSGLTGRIEQVPPAYSAKSVGGVRAHEAARLGSPLNLAPVLVDVFDWKILAERGPELDLRIECGTGTYIRSLARDLGRNTGSAAHLTRLRRTRSGSFDVADAVAVDTIRESRPPLRRLTVNVE
jgi:tRNA pseudouridine55 synthase